jgi:hypothetical protein
MPERHFPEPCEELDACFVVKDLNGHASSTVAKNISSSGNRTAH